MPHHGKDAARCQIPKAAVRRWSSDYGSGYERLCRAGRSLAEMQTNQKHLRGAQRAQRWFDGRGAEKRTAEAIFNRCLNQDKVMMMMISSNIVFLGNCCYATITMQGVLKRSYQQVSTYSANFKRSRHRHRPGSLSRVVLAGMYIPTYGCICPCVYNIYHLLYIYMSYIYIDIYMHVYTQITVQYKTQPNIIS